MRALVASLTLLLPTLVACEQTPSSSATCGDSIVGCGEQCDTANLAGATCEGLGFAGGTLSCSDSCQWNTAACIVADVCGNGLIDGTEACDGSRLGDETCVGLGFAGGTLACSEACQWSTEACVAADICGNGYLDGVEACDGTLLGGENCETLGYHGGELGCGSDCAFDVADCAAFGRCGDDTIQTASGEECDGAALDSATCTSRGYHGGDLACDDLCHYDEVDCQATGRCGDGAVQATYEACDGSDLGGNTCSSLGQGVGSVTCDASCQVIDLGCQDVLHVSADLTHSCALLADGTGRCWGRNHWGQLGSGSTDPSATPVVVAGLSSILGLVAGTSHSCALLADGTVQCWGQNWDGQLGDGTTDERHVPGPVPGLADALQIDASMHTCVVLGDHTVQCWGFNETGQLGRGTQTSSATPMAVTGLTHVTQVATGWGHTCALIDDGTVQCWGWNGEGQLGDGTRQSSPLPVVVPGITNAVEVTADHHSCALTGDGTALCWGPNDLGQLGDGTSGTDVLLPAPVTVVGPIAGIYPGDDHTCALLTDASVRCWGGNDYGQLGDGTLGTPRLVPVEVIGLGNVVQLSVGTLHTCALLDDGTARCWGLNADGQVGDGSYVHRSLPATVLFD